MDQIPMETQTLYAELLDQVRILEARRSIGHLKGGFTTKSKGGNTYYYFQHSEPGGARKQVYIGKESQAILNLVNKWQEEKQYSEGDMEGVQRLCSQARVGGAITTSHAQSRVLQSLADAGIFRMGGVLVGTYAFALMGNLLGYRWEQAGMRTEDIDIVSIRNLDLDLALPEQPRIDVRKVLDKLEMGFFPIPPLNHKKESTSYMVRKKALRVDVLTPSRTRGEDYQAVNVPGFNSAAQALPYLDYLIENPLPAVAINGGGILVNVPDPARYAFHKLIVAQERPVIEHGKKTKDLRQSSLLFKVLHEERPGDLSLAWQSLVARGASWEKKAREGFGQTCQLYPDTPVVID